MFFTNDEIDRGIAVDSLAANGQGGWKKANIWQLRTYNGNATSASENFFARVGDNGTVDGEPSNQGLMNEGRILCPEFTV